jgi:AraC-like DNA-binding protein
MQLTRTPNSPISIANAFARVMTASFAALYSTEPCVSDRLNFHSAVYFRKVFKGITGVNPTEYKRIHAMDDD